MCIDVSTFHNLFGWKEKKTAFHMEVLVREISCDLMQVLYTNFLSNQIEQLRTWKTKTDKTQFLFLYDFYQKSTKSCHEPKEYLCG